MRLLIKGTTLDITPALKVYIEAKLGRLLKLLEKMEVKQEFLLRVEVARTTRHHNKGQVYYAEANLDIGKVVLRAESENWNARLAINEVYRELAGEIKKFKGRLSERPKNKRT